MVKRGRSLADDKDIYVLKPMGRREETHKKQYAWICEVCNNSYLYRAEAEGCEVEHDKEAHPEKYIDKRVTQGHENTFRNAHRNILLLIKNGDRNRKLPMYKAKYEHSEKKLREIYSLMGLDAQEKLNELLELTVRQIVEDGVDL